MTTTKRQAAAPFPPPTATSEELITENLGLARMVATRYASKTGQPYDELEAVAYLGLIRGCRKYNPERINPATGEPYKLSTAVVPFVQGEVLHWFRDHGHTIKYPSRWREQWGRIQRLMADPDVPAEEVAERAGMTLDELREMLGAMTGTSNLDDHIGADGVSDAEPELDRLQPLRDLVLRALALLYPGDRDQLLLWWEKPRRLAFPSGPMQQFHRRLKTLLQGRRPTEVLQLALALDVEAVAVEKVKRQRRVRRELDDRVAQLGLLTWEPVASPVADPQPQAL